jgi:protein-tyrosine-phosphatase
VLNIASPKAPKGVLFLCRDNGARSLMAEAILNNFAGRDMRAYSAGIEPLHGIALPILQVIESHSVSIKELRPKRWNEFDGVGGLDFVFSICDPDAGEACAYWPGQPLRAHWHIPEPREGGNINEYYRLLDETYEVIFRCVNGFLNLPIEVMQKFALTREGDGTFVPDHLRVTPLPARIPTAS